ncbi:MAG TPA: right-handed parallel beta-helix repeat-containing protein, partial [Blastocatellia bacterium]
DTKPCSQILPCLTFNRAISLTNSNGEVVVLTSGQYAAFTANKSVTVEAPEGVYAGVGVSPSVPLTTNPPPVIEITGGYNVTLKGLTVVYQGVGIGSGIYQDPVTAGTQPVLIVEGCTISGFPALGIGFSGPGTLQVRDTTCQRNGLGIFVTASTNSATAVTIDHCRLAYNGGLVARQGALVMNTDASFTGVVFGTISNSTIANNENGIILGGPGVGLEIVNCLITQSSQNGISISGIATTSTKNVTYGTISNCAITYNSVGYYIQAGISPPGFLYTQSNNLIVQNGQTVGSLTPLTSSPLLTQGR